MRSSLFLLALSLFASGNASAEAFTLPVTCRKELAVSKGFGPNPITKLDIPAKVESNALTKLASTSRGGEAKSSKPFYQRPLFREMLAEFIGTFLIVQIGTGSVMSAIYTDSLVGLFQIASVWIIAVTVAICTTASISGAHLNPAVSLAFALIRPSKNFGWGKVLPYSLAQLLGAMAGSAVNFVMYASSISAFESANGIVRSTSTGLASAKAFGEYFG